MEEINNEPQVQSEQKTTIDPWKEEKTEKKTKKGTVDQFSKWAAVIQIVLLVFIAFQVNNMSGTNEVPSGNNPVAVPSAPEPKAPEPVKDLEGLMDDDSIKGKKEAPVTIVEFSDYECPFCERFYSQTYGQINEKYIKTGKVKLIFRDFPLGFHANAQKAAEAAECAGKQGKYYKMHDKLFEEGVKGGVDSYKEFAKEIGADTDKFDDCLDSGEMESEVKKDMLDGQKYGVQGTPAFFINGKLISGAQPLPVFEQLIEAELSS